jgi:hypothetical protein
MNSRYQLSIFCFGPCGPAAAQVSGDAGTAAQATQDILLRFFNCFLEQANVVETSTLWCLVRISGILILATIVCRAILAHAKQRMPHGSIMVLQWLSFAAVIYLIAQIDLTHVPLNPSLKGFLLAVSLLALAILPWRLSALLVPRESTRRSVAIGLYFSVILLVLIQKLL